MNLKLNAVVRKTVKKSEVKDLRKDGKIPAVIYGTEVKPVSITLSESEFTKAYRKSFAELTFFEIEVDGKNYHTIIREKQMHPVSRKTLHVDFYALSETRPVTVEIPVKYIGEPAAVKSGARLYILARTLKVKATPANLPAVINVDITDLKIGGSFRVANLDFENLVFMSPSDMSLAVLAPPKGATSSELEEGEEGEEAEAAE